MRFISVFYLSLCIFIQGCATYTATDYSKDIDYANSQANLGVITTEQKQELLNRATEKYQDSHNTTANTGAIVDGTLTVLKWVFIIALIGTGVYFVSKSGGSSNYVPIEKDSCDCPGDTAIDGSRCGLRSAFSRSGGRSPSCIGRL